MTTVQKQFIIGRPINGVSINGLEYLLDESNEVMLFNTSDDAVTFLQNEGFSGEEINEFTILEEEERIIKFTTDIGYKVSYTEEEFREDVRSTIDFAVGEKEYPLQDLTPNFIAEDITGIFGEHGISKEGLDIIEQELKIFKV